MLRVQQCSFNVNPELLKLKYFWQNYLKIFKDQDK